MATPHYDAIVIGAGPAGCMAALTLARRGVRTLVVEKSSRGRWKVCGCCLGALGQAALRQADLGSILSRSMPVDALTLAARGQRATTTLCGFVSLSRESLDAALADAAARAGAEFRWRTPATSSSEGIVTLGDDSVLRAGVIIDATGLRGQRVDHARVAARARIGIGLSVRDVRCEPGVLTMAVGRGGYLGRVGLPDGRVDFAAALKPSVLRASGGPVAAARALWAQAGLDPEEVPEGHWRGTPALTRRRSPHDGRILRVGDAAGYVEPFTGEGMSWAMHAASCIADDAIACIEHGPSSVRWTRTLRGLLSRRHARCRVVSLAVRSPLLVCSAVRLSSSAPGLGTLGAAGLSGSGSAA